MREWYPTAELTGLPDLPLVAWNVTVRANRDGWRSRAREGRGGGREYHISSLPEAARAELARREMQAAAQQADAGVRRLSVVAAVEHQVAIRIRSEGLEQLAKLAPTDRDRATARIDLLGLFRQYQLQSHLPISKALISFCHLYNHGEIEAPESVRGAIADVHPATMQRWRRALKAQGAAALAGNYGNRKGSSKIETQDALQTFAIGFLYEFPHASARHLHDGIKARFGDRDDIDMPSAKGVERWITKFKRENAQTFAAVTNPDLWKNRHMVAFGSMSENIDRLNQLWELDSTPGDLLLLDGRHALVGVIDVYTRRFKLHVTPTSRATAIAALVRRAILDWGMPEWARMDNGQDYVGHHTTRVLQALDIEPIYCPPFQPWHKPHIERAFRTFSHHLVELLPGYCGHNVADRQAIEARKSFADRLMTRGETIEVQMSSEDLQRFADRWVENFYHHEQHGGLNGRTPFEMVAGWTGPVRRASNERALDLLLAEAPDNHGFRTVHKKGIRLKWPSEPQPNWYIAPELEAHIGNRVRVLFDPLGDMGRIYVFGGEEFIGIAECPELAGIDRREYAAIAKTKQRERVQAERRAMREAARVAGTKGIAEEILAARERETKKLFAFSGPATEITTAGLRAAADAVAATDNRRPSEPRPLTEQERQAHERLVEQFERADEDASVEEDPNKTYAQWMWLEREIDQYGYRASEEEIEGLAIYKQSIAYRASVKTFSHFALEIDQFLPVEKRRGTKKARPSHLEVVERHPVTD